VTVGKLLQKEGPMTIEMPSQVSGDKTAFDRFASWCARAVSRAPFFAFCVLLILVWAPTVSFLKFDTWQLIINTVTTIITFLMVALLQNAQTRNDLATQHKLNAIADALADLMEHFSEHAAADIDRDIEELRDAVGIEKKESTSKTN
jgi:low affinity Fe/Cu permease